jgi:hypothetical protein
MPFNLIKKYPEPLELGHYNPYQRKECLRKIFNRDIENNPSFKFRRKQIRPTKKEGEPSMDTLFGHLITRDDKDDKGKKLGTRSFEMERSVRLHWVKPRTEELKNENVVVFSYEDRVKNRGDVIRTYIYDKDEKYVVILEPQKSNMDYYLLTAYYLNEPGGEKQITKKLKKKLDEVH